MDLSGFPPAALWRWNLALRLLLAIAGPLALSAAAWSTIGVVPVAAAMTAALVSLASLGPDLSSRRWEWVAVLGVPVALGLGALASRLPAGGTLLVFVLFTVHGAMVRAGLLAQLAWFPVATAGLLAALLFAGTESLSDLMLGAALGSLWALVLLRSVASRVRTPQLPIPPEALTVDTSRLRRMVRSPTGRDWLAPLALGALSAGLLAVTALLTGGFKPYWSVLAFVSVLAPSSAKTRDSVVETVLGSAVGVLLAAVVLSLGLPQGAELGLIAAMGMVGALLLLRNGMLAKALMTPLPVVFAAAALDSGQALALQLRLVEYVVGAALGFATVVGGELLGRRLFRARDAEIELAG